jgi:hypothetical protein
MPSFPARKTAVAWAARLPDVYTDASIAVDVRLVGETASRYVGVGCRQPAPPEYGGYRLMVAPGGGRFELVRLVGDVRPENWQPSAAIRGGEQSNRLELSCVGSRITASINGTQVASLVDESNPEGQIVIQADGRDTSSTVDARFENLVVTSWR